MWGRHYLAVGAMSVLLVMASACTSVESIAGEEPEVLALRTDAAAPSAGNRDGEPAVDVDRTPAVGDLDGDAVDAADVDTDADDSVVGLRPGGEDSPPTSADDGTGDETPTGGEGAPATTLAPPVTGGGDESGDAGTTPSSPPSTNRPTPSPPTTEPPSTPPTTSPPTTPAPVAAPPTPAGGRDTSTALAVPELRSTSTPSHLRAVGTDQRTLVVDQANGSDGNSGDAASPWQTLRRALDVVQPGDTVLVRNGVYSEGRGGPVLSRSGTASAWITIAAYPGERPLVRPGEGSGLRLQNAHFVEIRGLEFQGLPSTDYGSGVRLAEGSSHVRIVGNRMHGWAGSGISTTDSASVLIEENVVYDNADRSPFQTSGISMYQAVGPVSGGTDNVIRWNIVYGNENVTPRPDGQLTDGNCVIIDDFRHDQGGSPHAPYRGSTLVAANSCFDNGGRGVLVYKSDRVLVEANVLVENLLTRSINGGELTAAQATGVRFERNLVVAGSTRPAVYLDRTNQISSSGNTFVAAEAPIAGADDTWVVRDQVELPSPITRIGDLPGR